MKSSQLTIGIVSDLHCHHSSAGPAESLLLTDADRKPASQHPVEALLELITSESLRADIVIAPGDLTNKVDKQGIISGWGFVREISSALGAKLLAATPGNHDVTSRVHTDDPFQLARRLSPSFPISNATPLNEFWANGFCTLDADHCRVLLINSVAHHNNDVSAKRGLITTNQIDQIKASLKQSAQKVFQIAVCHHHPVLHEDIGLGTSDVMENGSLLIDALSELGFHLVVHGHKHHPRLSYAVIGATPHFYLCGRQLFSRDEERPSNSYSQSLPRHQTNQW